MVVDIDGAGDRLASAFRYALTRGFDHPEASGLALGATPLHVSAARELVSNRLIVRLV